MGTFEKDEMPMLSPSFLQSDENDGFQNRRFTYRTRSASLSMPMSSMESFENDSSFVGYTGPLRSERRTSLVHMSGPLYISRKPENSFRPTPAAVVHKPTLPTTEKYPSIGSAERNGWPNNDYTGKNEHLLKSGQLGMCSDPYCTTCPTYYHLKARQKNSKSSDIIDHRFHNMLYGDAKGWAKRTCSFLHPYIPGVMNPHAKIVQQWNKFFVISCLFAVFIDPLFFFLLYVQQGNKCIVLNWPMTTTIVILRSITDIIYLIHILLQFPTPIHKWNLPNLPKDTEVWLKRDDISGMQLSGNKVRKLEFLLGDAVAQGADCIVTIGGIQSNHCRATAVAAKYLNLDCYLILRTSKLLVDKDPGLIGNLLVERLVGAHIDLVSKEEYAKVGSEALTKLLKEKLLSEGRKPYVIPVGGSNSLGTWGYIEAIREVEQQLQHSSSEWKFDDIVVACGSGGTVAGLSIASRLSGLKAKVNAFCVCDDPDYFYEYVQGLLDGNNAGVSSRDIVSIQNAKGLGYAMSTADELKFVKQVAEATGVILDPVYSGKAAYGMMKDMNENPTKWEGRKILFIHTGGLLGLYDKADEMASLMGKWRKMDINESIPRQDGIGKMF